MNRGVEVIDLFCGGGGASHGFLRAGLNIVLAVDSWEVALDIHRLNHPNVKCELIELGGSIPIFARYLRSKLNPLMHFHLHGSPPCQNISTASMGDPKDGMILVNWFLDLVAYMKPDSWSLENVLPTAKHFDSSTPFVQVNAADYGVPQKRKRIFAGEGWVLTPTHTSTGWVSVLDALPHLKKELNITSKSPIRIVSRRKKKGEEPQSYDPSDSAHTITQVNHIIERLDSNIEKVRSLSLGECATLQGWPEMLIDNTISKKHLQTVIGNMVCPPITYQMGLSIKDLI